MLRELVWMAEAKGRDSWAHTSAVLALVANVNRSRRGSRVFKPGDFNPFESRRRAGMPLTAENLSVLRRVFVDPRGGR
jgi:hypothetical protein